MPQTVAHPIVKQTLKNPVFKIIMSDRILRQPHTLPLGEV